MTIAHIVLLTGETEAPVLTGLLREHNPDLAVTVIGDRTALAALPRAQFAQTRLISFCSSIIVPAGTLAAMPGPSYNFHPGPPERPGRFPSVWAVYERCERYGITVHEMTARVDAGPIVNAEWFAVPDGIDLLELEQLALAHLIAAFRRLAPFLAQNPRPLPRVYIPWSGTKRTKADCDDLCRITPGMSADEIARRRRACGTHLRD